MNKGPLRNRVLLHQRDREALEVGLRAACVAVRKRWEEDDQPPDESYEAALNGDALAAVLAFLAALPPDGVAGMFIGRGALRLVRPHELRGAVEKVALIYMDDFDADPQCVLPEMLEENPELTPPRAAGGGDE